MPTKFAIIMLYPSVIELVQYLSCTCVVMALSWYCAVLIVVMVITLGCKGVALVL